MFTKNQNLKKIRILVLILICMLITGIVIISIVRKSEEKIDTYTVTCGNISNSVSGTGVIQYADQKNIYTKIEGYIIKSYFDNGDIVQEGDLLYEFDSTEIEQMINKNQIQYDKAKIQYDNATGAEKKIYALEMSEAELSINEYKEKLKQCKIYSPLAGKVFNQTKKEGDYCDSNEIIAVVGNPQTLCVDIMVYEENIKYISLEQQATVTVKALNQSYNGRITNINSIGNSNNGITSYNVTVSIEDNDVSLFNAMSATVNITIESKENVLIIPSYLVDEGNVVYLLEDNEKTIHPVNINVGISDGDYIEVTSGLSQGDSVVIDFKKYKEEIQ